MAMENSRWLYTVNRSIQRVEVLADLLNKKTPTSAGFVQWGGAYSIPSDTDIIINAIVP